MKDIFNQLAHSDWFLPIALFLGVTAYFAIESRWEAYTRRKNYEELKLLDDLRQKNIITQAEFDERKEELLGV